MKLEGKIIISGLIETLTGLHIGGSKSALDIGGVDLNVIKTPNGEPFIPGSSLKGKLRSLLGRKTGKLTVEEDLDYVKEIFGHADNKKPFITRLLVRDAPLQNKSADIFTRGSMEFEYSDVKWENRINRKTGTAIDPRQLERVPAGAKFSFEIVYDLYDDALDKGAGSGDKTRLAQHLEALELAMRLLQDDYLGGQGSRGYGQVIFRNVGLTVKKIGDGDYAPVKEIQEVEILNFQTKISLLHAHASRHSEV